MKRLDDVMKGPFGEAPPFVLSGCLEKVVNHNIDANGFNNGNGNGNRKDEKISFCRIYRWGTCYLNKEEHTDFTLLKTLLIYYLSPHFKSIAETYYRQYFENLEHERAEAKRQNEEDIRSKIFMGIGIVVVVAIALYGLSKYEKKPVES